MPPPGLSFDILSESDLPAAFVIEEQGFHPDEAATLETFQFRLEHARDLFLGAYVPEEKTGRQLIGYVCSTLSPDETLTQESMSKHVPNSSSVCIHSVCVSRSFLRQGVALALLKEYVNRLREAAGRERSGLKRVLLISHEELLPLYQKAGFQLVGKSKVVHGPFPWYEMQLSLE